MYIVIVYVAVCCGDDERVSAKHLGSELAVRTECVFVCRCSVLCAAVVCANDGLCVVCRCTHAVSKTPEGPYGFEDVAVINWCHNPAVVVQSFPNGTYLWALFHIGDGTGGSTKNCTTSAVVDSESASVEVKATGSNLHIATSPNGPWCSVMMMMTD